VVSIIFIYRINKFWVFFLVYSRTSNVALMAFSSEGSPEGHGTSEGPGTLTSKCRDLQKEQPQPIF
jgi:hypothetical protein